jgi:hypothetical protein
MTESLELIVTALNLLDEAEAPGDIGAHLDLARERLSRTLNLMHQSEAIARHASSRPAA